MHLKFGLKVEIRLDIFPPQCNNLVLPHFPPLIPRFYEHGHVGETQHSLIYCDGYTVFVLLYININAKLEVYNLKYYQKNSCSVDIFLIP